MRTVYVVQNDDDVPVMAFYDKETAKYVANNNEGTRGIFYAATLFECEVATDAQIAEMNGSEVF